MLAWLSDMAFGFSQVFDLTIMLCAFIGVGIGIIIGVIPGLGPALAISLAIPITYNLGPLPAISLLLGIYKGGTYGGSISAILINTPGTPAAMATIFDGYPLTKQGKSGKALNLALYCSVIGDALGIGFLCIFAQFIAVIAIKFGPTETFGLMVFALTIISVLSGDSLLKGLAAGCVGLMFSTIGADPMTGVGRYTFGSFYLEDGLPIIPMVIGMFAIAEVLNQTGAYDAKKSDATLIPDPKQPSDAHVDWKEFKHVLPIIGQSSAIGVTVGSLPGTGATTAAFLSYGNARRRSKKPQEFGHGSIEGLAAAESGNNAVCGGALIPMLTMGIPGDVITAILMSALTIHGINVGPYIFDNYRDFVFTLFAMLLVSVCMLLILGKVAVWGCRKLATAPQAIIMPVVIVMCALGAYADRNTAGDLWFMLAFGITAWFWLRVNFPITPFLLAFILAPKMEVCYRQAMVLSRGDISVFFTRPICLLFILLTALVVVQIYRLNRRKKMNIRKEKIALLERLTRQ